MNDAIAQNIRQHRQYRSWTQEHLADAAGLSVRTVQRAEEGRGMGAETLSAIAGAFDVPLDELRSDPHTTCAELLGVAPEELTPELVAAKAKEALDKYAVVQLSAVTCSADLRPVLDCEAFCISCGPTEDEIQDAAAELDEMLRDLADTADDVGPMVVRDALKEAFDVVDRLAGLGCTVSVGVDRFTLRHKSGSSAPWSILYLVVTPESETKRFAMVERRNRTDWRL